MGFVYLMLEVSANGMDEAHKIGVTKRPIKKRLSELQTGNSNNLSILKFYESKNYLKIEQMLHAKYEFNQSLAKNEFFILSNNDIIEFINQCKKFDETITFLLRENHFFK